MMNFFSLVLILTSVAAASLFSPSQDSNNQVLREGHRLIVVEFERQLLPPPYTHAPPSSSPAGEVASEANEGQGLSQPLKEKICDAFGVCKDKVSSIFTHTKNKASEHKAAQYHDSASDAFKTAKEKAAQFEESASDAVKTAKQNAAELQTSVVEKAKDAADVVSANISATAGKAADLAVAAAGELRRNLTEILRQTRELGRDTAAFVGAGKAVRSVAAVTHLLGTATAYGACIWVTFASSHVLAEALPRQQFGVVQSRLYPLYFRFVAVGVAVAFGGHLLRRGWRSGEGRMQGYILMATLAIVLVNLLCLEPRATKAMFDRMKMEKEEGQGRQADDFGTEAATPAGKEVTVGGIVEVKKRLKRLNTYSSICNVLTCMALSYHLVQLAQCLASDSERCK
ncbi:hypothetical protein HPP92_005352 [Vanilla planifolia]|uniref:TMEM205-like domain-containing protein n=2 Tax=Vanilla planifolia TaxID=51239 RepID=A0A835RYL2_VANPL|nr:hypothetical protein HPP92_005352 [Vanilla planifolia]